MRRRRPFPWRAFAVLIFIAAAVAAAVVIPNPLRRTVKQVAVPLIEASASQPHFGCDPGPSKPAPPQNELNPIRPVALVNEGTLLIDGRLAGRPIAGVGFNIEPTLWTCPEARPLIEQRIFDTFRPDLIRVGLAQAPWAPDDADTADDLTWDAYQRVLASPAFQPSWEFIAMLNQRGITPIVAPWGVPGLLTDNGEPTGRLKPEYFEKYAEYYAAAVDYLVRQRGLRIGPASVMNEPDCGDGSHISPRDFPRVARLVGERLAEYGVKLYGPDTCNADSATRYLDALVRDGNALEYFEVIGTHQYAPGGEVAELVREMREAGLTLPLYVTEYTTYRYGNLDDGQEAPAEMPYLLEIATVLQSHLTGGADAAIYWDAVDYYWLLHDAISKWGLLRGPQVQPPLTPRKHYYGLLQILPYLRPGARIISTSQRAPTTLLPLVVERPDDG